MRAVSWKLILFVLATLLLMPMTPAQGSLVAYYTFEGNASDVTGHGYDGAFLGTDITPTAGYEGQAYFFNTKYVIEIPLNINPSNYPQLTMGAWVQSSATRIRPAGDLL